MIAVADDELLRRVVKTCRALAYRKGTPHPRFVAVMDNFLLGSTSAAELCRRFGFDPDEMVRR